MSGTNDMPPPPVPVSAWSTRVGWSCDVAVLGQVKRPAEVGECSKPKRQSTDTAEDDAIEFV